MALHTKVDGEGLDAQYLSVSPLFAPHGESTTVPKHRMPDQPMAAEMAYEIIHDELMLDGNARLNLATFVTTWMGAAGREADGRMLRQEHDRQGRVSADGRAGDALRQHAEPPVELPRHRFGDPMLDNGLKRAAMLGGLALKRRWQQRRRAAGESAE